MKAHLIEESAPAPASVPATIVNWAGSETVSAEEYCAYLGELVGREARIEYDEKAPWPIWPSTTLSSPR